MLLLFAFVLGACAKQAEGERCDLGNGHADCEAPLLCVSTADLAGAAEIDDAALCCPPATTQSSIECVRASVLPPDDPAGSGGSSGQDAAVSGTGGASSPDPADAAPAADAAND